MAITFSLTDGTRTIALVGSSSYTVPDGIEVGMGESVPRWHRPDGYAPELIDLHDDIRTARFRLHAVNSGGIDSVLNDLITIKRWVDGANCQAARAETEKDTAAIYLKVQLDSATNATLHRVKYGAVEDGMSHYTYAASNNAKAIDARVTLYLAEYGEAENTISLQSDLENGAFLKVSGTPGLAANWTLAGTPTQTLNGSIKLIGNKSQKIVASSGSPGIRSDEWTAGGTSAAAYVWLYVTSGSVGVRIWDVTAASEIVGAVLDSSDSGGVSDKTHTDDGGRTWYRVPVTSSGGLTASNSYRLDVFAETTPATFYVDGAWMLDGTSSVPDAWVSYTSIKNRADWGTSNTDRINWVDVWGVPGDAPALLKTDLGYSTGSSDTVHYFGIFKGGTVDIDEPIYAIENTALVQGGGSGSYSSSAATGTYHGGSYGQYTEGVTENGATLSAQLTAEQARALRYGQYRLFAAVRENAAGSVTISPNIGAGLSVTPNTTTLSLGSTVWEFVDLGLIIPTEIVDTDADISMVIGVEIGGLANGETFDIDAIFLFPVSAGFIISTSYAGSSTNLYVDGQKRQTYHTYGDADALGEMYTIQPAGDSRIHWITTLNDAYNLTLSATVTLTVTPRTRHLLGTT